MPFARRVAPWCLVIGLTTSGCAAWPLLLQQAARPRPDTTTVSPAGEDGTRYVAVEGGRLTSDARLRSRWSSTSRRVCEGEFLEIARSSHTQRQAGVARRRVHEGFIRCVGAEPQEPSRSPSAPTMADAEGTETSRDRAAARGRRGSRILGRR